MVLRLFALLLLSFLLVPPSSPASDRLVIEGTGDSQKLLRHLARSYLEKDPDSVIEIRDCIGSSGGIRAVSRGSCSLAHVSRKLLSREESFKLNYRLFAQTPMVFAANLPERCADGLTTEQMLAIFSGKISNWKDIGTCPEHKIYVAHREQGDSSRMLLAQTHEAFQHCENNAGEVIYSTPNTVTILKETPYTIAYLPLAAIAESDLVVFALDGVAPTEQNLLNKSYPFVMPLGFVWRGRQSELALAFFSFVFGSEGAEIIRQYQSLPASAQVAVP